MRKLKFVFQIIIAFIVALAAYSGLYQPNAESVRATVKNNMPQSMQQKQDTGAAQGRLRISVLDVGQADAILLQDGKRNIMIDVGNDVKDKVGDSGGRQALIKALDKAGVNRIKTVFVTHHHRDHMGNIMYVRGKYGVSNIYDSGYVNSGYKASVALDRDLRAGRYNGQALKAGDKITIDKNYYIEVLAPGDFLSKKDLKNMNNTSLVLMLHYGSFKMLLTGDAEAPVEDALQQKYGTALQADVLKVGHHGSKTSSYWPFISKVKPKYALISCGDFSIYKHPNKNVVGSLTHLGVKVLTTHDHGTLTVTTDGKSFDVLTER
ncbi:MBL fold metallo-hydrolase [Phascolarctobacterium sp. Marseille-Q4147]|uniref:ComEC/Rec2 family competence protein n=1 Tax=Phascolarctobacterium sp. Marseille-Q4147 TaxID=2823317 RepID=UPI001B342BAC|nr:MBL fold metallo-hydrolase [Phascolarctobacterium sp. Marseille-Q4147]QTV77910.1 MBL fold metallo-hydrolase [Phascolarctobacterium sp. Marseille-Q4147]